MSLLSSLFNRITSVGFIVGVIAVCSSVFPFFGAWGLSEWFDVAAEDRHLNAYFWTMLVALIGGGAMTLFLAYIAYRSRRSVGDSHFNLDDLDDSVFKGDLD